MDKIIIKDLAIEYTFNSGVKLRVYLTEREILELGIYSFIKPSNRILEIKDEK